MKLVTGLMALATVVAILMINSSGGWPLLTVVLLWAIMLYRNHEQKNLQKVIDDLNALK